MPPTFLKKEVNQPVSTKSTGGGACNLGNPHKQEKDSKLTEKGHFAHKAGCQLLKL